MAGGRLPCAVPFDLAQTLDCGQAFRWREVSPGRWEGAAFGKVLALEQQGEQVWFLCAQEDLEATWQAYFDLEADYGSKRAALSQMSPALKEAADFAPGIRILRQEPWEAQVMEAAMKMPKKNFQVFQQETDRLAKKYLEELNGDVTHFCRMFDYRNAGGDWGNSKDAIERAIQYLTARVPEDRQKADEKNRAF